jgi:hypothetical protein
MAVEQREAARGETVIHSDHRTMKVVTFPERPQRP